MAFQRAPLEEVVTCLWVTVAASWLNSFPLSSTVCVCVCACVCLCVQLLLPSSAGSMTSSRTTTPATIRRRPSRRPRGARRSTTAEGCWGARWARLLWTNADRLSQSQSLNFLHTKKPAHPSLFTAGTCALSYWNIPKCVFLLMMCTCNVFVFVSHHAAEALPPPGE